MENNKDNLEKDNENKNENNVQENQKENKVIENKNEDNKIINNENKKEKKIYDNNLIKIERQNNIEIELNKNNDKALDNENKKNIDNIINNEIKINKELKAVHNNIFEIIQKKRKNQSKPSNCGHSKMKQIYKEIKAEALNKSKKKEEVNNNQDNNEINTNNNDDENNNINKIFVNITEDGGIQKRIIKNGKGNTPTEGKTVFIKYIGKYGDKIFEQTPENEVCKFTIDENKVIKGWEIAVKSMKIGEKSEFIMHPEYTYGDKVINDWIPPNSILNYEIELLCIGNNDPDTCLENMSYEEKIQWGKLLKSEGVSKFKSNDITGAKECFLKALPFLKTFDITKEEEKEGVELYLTILSNLCNCYNKEKEYNSVVEFATIGLKIKITPKLLYFRAIAFAFNEEFENANNDYESLSKFFLENIDQEGNNNDNIEQTLKYVKYILDDRKQVYVEKNKKYSRAFYRQFLYYNKNLKTQPLIPPKEVNLENPIVFFEIKIGEKNVGKIEFELFKDISPITVKNFRCLCIGNNDNMSYKGTSFNKIIKNFVIGGGELEKNNEKKCIYGEYFDDENYIYAHCRRGLLTMDNEGKNKNNSKFLITLKYLPWFDGKHVVFGQLINGYEIINQIGELETDDNDKPLVNVCIENCGEILDKENIKIEIPKDEIKKEENKDIKIEQNNINEIKDEEGKDKTNENKEIKKEKNIEENNNQNNEQKKEDEDKDLKMEENKNQEKVIKKENEDLKKNENNEEIKKDNDLNNNKNDKIIENLNKDKIIEKENL